MSGKRSQSNGKRRGSLMSGRLLRTSSLSALALLALPSIAQAQDAIRNWDPNGTAAGTGGAGTWDTSAPRWSPNADGVSGPYAPWNNAGIDNAIFGGPNGTNVTVTLGAPIVAHNLTFDPNTTYTLTGGTLTLAGATPTITTNGAATINSILAGSAGLTKAGAGGLTLTGVNTFSGGVNVNAGALIVSGDSALGAASNAINLSSGATLRSTGALASSRVVTLLSGSTGIGGGVGSAHLTGAGGFTLAAHTTLSDDTNDFTGAVGTAGYNLYFTSIRNLGEASALGAATTAANGAVYVRDAYAIYTGDGDTSNRGWSMAPGTASSALRNQGTGTLTVTGDIGAGGGYSASVILDALTADLALQGVISSNLANRPFIFTGGGTSRSITLGAANTFGGAATIQAVTVKASSLANQGVASSLGTGAGAATIALNGGTLDYVGTGGGSNRGLFVNGASSILNDGTGALALSGAVTFNPANPGDTLTLGGSFAGGNALSGVISGAGNLVMNGDAGSAWLLGGTNSFTGVTTVLSGTLRAGGSQAFGTPNAIVVNGGTLDLNTHAIEVASLAGTGGSVALTGADLTVNGAASTSYAGGLTGAGGLVKRGTGTLTLTGQSAYTGDTTINGGSLALNFGAAGAPASDIIGSASTLNMAGGTLTLTGAAGLANSQTFNGLEVTAGNNRIVATSGAGGAMTLNLGALTRTGGLMDFTLPASGAVTTSNGDGALGWATVNGADYAQVQAGAITAFTAYANKDDASTWLTGDIVSDTGGAVNTPFANTVAGNVQLGGLKYTAANDSTVTVGGGGTLGVDGTIIVASSVGNASQTITGGSLSGSAGGGALGVLHNGTGAGAFTIASTIVDNGGTSFIKGGAGRVALTGVNSYAGGTTLSGGTLAINSIANGGVASSIGASSAASSNLVIESGTLEYTGLGAGTTDRGFTLVNGGPSRTIQVANGGANLTFGGVVVGPDDAGFSKTGAGTLTLANAANTYTGVTTVSGGALSVGTLANGGAASGIGASTADPANLVLQGGGGLQYTGGSVGSDRGFTLGTGGGRIGVSDSAATLTLSGPATGSGGLTKEGGGTLVLSGANLYAGGTTISAGTLRAGSAQAFGSQTALMTVNAGATLDLAGFTNRVGALAGGGNVLLGSATLVSGGTNGAFSGTISGGGGFYQAAGGVQTMVGCNNSYTGVTTVNGSLSVDCLANGGLASGIGASGAASSNLVLTSGTLTYTGTDVTTNRGFMLGGGDGGVAVSSGTTTLGFTGQVTGAGRLRKFGAGTLLLSGTNIYSGGTVVDAGTLRAGSTSAFGTGGVAFNSAAATLDLAGNNNSVLNLQSIAAGLGHVSLGGATLTITNGSNANYSGTIDGAGNLVKSGGPTAAQVLAGCNSSYTGSTTVASGWLQVACLSNGGANSSIGASTSGSGNLVLNGGALQYIGAAGSTDRQFTLGSSGGGLEAYGSGAINFTSTAAVALAGSGSRTLTLAGSNADANTLFARLDDPAGGATALTKTGTGAWILRNSGSTYTGVTTISGGVLGVDKLANGGVASSIGASSAAASNLIIGNGSTLRYTGAGDTTNRLFTLSAGTTFIESSGTGAVVFTDTGAVTLAGTNQARTIALGGTNTGNNTLAGSIGNAGAGITTLAKNDSGTWVLTGNNTFTGNTVINDGNLMIGNGGTTGNAGAGNVIVNAPTSTLSFNRSDTFNFTGTLSGPGSIAQIGAGATVLTSAGNSIGAATISAGTLQVNGGLATSTIAMTGASALTVNGTVQAAGGNPVVITGDTGASTITVNTGATLAANGDLGDGGDVVTLGGTLATGGAVLGLGLGADTLTLNDGGAITGAGVNAGAGVDTLLVNNALARTLDAASVGGFETLTKQNTGVLTLTGAHGYSAGTTIAAGTLQIGNGGTTGSIAGNVTDNGTLAFNRSDTLTYADVISGAGAVAQVGSGTTVLTGANSYTGGTTISAGTLQIGNGGATGAIVGNVTNNGSLVFNRSDNIGFAGLISGAGSVVKNGAGLLILTASNSYSGPTNVAAGTLRINGDQSGATGLTTVFNGATLGGSGTVGGSVLVNNGGTLAPGNSPGTLTINGDLSLASGSILDFEFGQADVVGGPLNDLINVGGNLTLDGTINVSVPAGGSFGGGIYRVFNYGGTLTNNGLSLGTMPGGSNVAVQTSVAGQVNLVNSAGLALSFWDGDAGPKFNGVVNGGGGTWHLGGVDNNWTDATGGINASYADGSFAVFAGAPGLVTVDNGSGAVTAAGMQFASNGYGVTGAALTLIGPQSTIRVGDGTPAGAAFTATIAAQLTGATQLVKTDLGTLILTGANSYTGGTAINGGVLQIANDANLGGAAGGLSFNGGGLQVIAPMVTSRDISLAGDGTLDVSTTFNAATALTLAGDITGPGALTKIGLGRLTLIGDATHTGVTTIARGSLQIGDGGSTGSIAGDIVVTSGTGLGFDRADSYTYGGSITGGGTVSVLSGILTATGNSSMGGNLSVSANAELRVTAGNLVATTGLTNLDRGRLTVSGPGSTLQASRLNAVAAVGINSTVDVLNGGVIRTTSSGTGLQLRTSSGTGSSNLSISGAGSLVDLTGGGLQAAGTQSSTSIITISDSGSLRTSGASQIGAVAGNTIAPAVTITGTGSNWTSTSSLAMTNGGFSLLNGGTASFTTATMGSISAARPASVLVSGTNSQLTTSSDLVVGSGVGTGVLTLADGGRVNVGGAFVLADAGTATGILNIGGAEGQAAAATGLFDAATLNLGSATSRLNFNHTDPAYTFATVISGAGNLNQVAGTTILTGANSYGGATTVSGGTLLVNGDQSAATGATAVNIGGALGGIGVIGGNVSVANGATLAPGDATGPGTLAINGDLALAGGATLNYDFGQANVVGGAFNDLVNVGGDLTLAGTLNVATSGGGAFDPGVYRVINYSGALTNNGLSIGSIPAGTDFYVQTSVANQVNLINTSGLALRFWDGASGGRNDGVITGGDGVWQNVSGNDNWTLDDASINAPFLDSAFAIFGGAAGTVSVDSGLGAVRASGMQFATNGYAIEGDALDLAGAQAIIRVGDGSAAGAAYTATINSELAGAAQLVKTDLGTLVLTGTNSYAGGTVINGGTLRIASDANLGATAGGLSFGGGALNSTADVTSNRAVDLVGAGAFLTDAGTTLTLNGAISGAGGLTKAGAGSLVLTGTNNYAGATTVTAGSLFVSGDQSAATGLVSVASGALLGGSGIIGGDVTLADGATLAAGAGNVGTLAINGNLALGAGSVLDFEFGAANIAGGSLNDLVNVGGDLTLDGTINVSTPTGGSFGPGVYRVFNYGGSLTDDGLALGTMPGGSSVSVQTAIAGQINLVNTAGLTLSFWDGNAGPKNDGAVNGGDGVWRMGGGSNNWTDASGTPNADYAQDSFAIFSAAPGTVTVDDASGDVLASGMQFASDGYVVTGDALTLTGAQAIVQVGDGSAAGAGYTAAIGAELTGSAGLVKTDAGTLVLTGANSYTGGAAINGGVLRIASDANLGDAAGALSFDGGTLNTTADIASSRAVTLAGSGAFLVDPGTTLTLGGTVSGGGALTKDGAGSLVLTAGNVYTGGATIAAGTLQLGNGGTSGSILGNVLNNGVLAFNRSDSLTFAGAITGGGAVNQLGAGTTILTGGSNYTGGTTISAGTLQLGNGGTSGSITGDVVNNAALAFIRSDAVTFAGRISGSGTLAQAGAGTTILTANNSYAGATNVSGGTLLINGDQSAATGATSVASGATLGGAGTIGGDVALADGATLAPGAGGAGALTVNGDLALSSGSLLAYEFGLANAPGSPLNDVVNVGGDLTLDGAINVAVTPGGAFDIGLYRIANYGGALTDNGLAIGAMPAGADLFVQTSVANQVNLINTGSAVLNFWDGAAGPKFNGVVNGGDGVWQNGAGNNNWADATGAVNAGYDNGAFAIFTGAPGAVTIDNSLGAVAASGLQFATGGYAISGGDLTLTGPQSVIRVGDGTAAGAGYTATINSAITGATQLVKTDAGTLVLAGANSYTGGTAINGGAIRIADDASLGAAAGGLSLDGGTLNTTADLSSARAVDLAGAGAFLTDAGTTLNLTGAVFGSGGLTKSGAGTLVLSGAGSYAGATTVAAGTLLINGNFGAATGATTVASGASLGGTGAIGGDVTLASGATLTPGAGGAGTLAIGGDLSLAAGTTLAYEFGAANTAGGALNDLVNVGGDLTLDGAINVTVPTGGAFEAGVYRVFNYAGALTDNGLVLGSLPAGSDVDVQTSIAGQVNLVNAAGLTLNFWDGASGPKNNGVINGGNGVWQNSSGNDNWTNANGAVNAAYSDSAFAVFGGAGGAVTVDNTLGQVNAAGMQFAADGYVIAGGGVVLTGTQSTIRVGDGSVAGAGFTATINAALSGDAQLVKTDAGTLILGGVNSHTGGTRINGGAVQISADANLGAATGGVTLDGGALATSANLTSARDVVMAGAGTISTASGTTFTYGGLLSGTGALTKAGAGVLLMTGDNGGFAGATTVSTGVLAVTGKLGGAVNVNSGGRLEGTGQVGNLVNAGTVAPGRDGFGVLTVNGSYAGSGGTLEIEAALGGDGSQADRLVVANGTSGTTAISVTNRGGLGAQTVEGIKIVDVTGGASNGTFTLRGDYSFEGSPAVIAGAFGYRLFQNGVPTPADGDWYLRSALLDAAGEPQGPLYQPGAPLYESYVSTLQTLNGLSTLQERVGNRQWSGVATSGIGLWGRIEGARLRPEAAVSTSGADVNTDTWGLQFGFDVAVVDADRGVLIAGVNGRYGAADARIRSRFGNGRIDTNGYSLGATLTWYGHGGFYADAQAQASWYDSDLDSDVLGRLIDDSDGSGEALSLEVGQRLPIGGGFSLTPQAQITYSNVRFNAFFDPSDAIVSSEDGDSLRGRLGLSLDHQRRWQRRSGGTAQTHVYGVASLEYEMRDGSRVDVSGAPLLRREDRLWGKLGMGGTYSWDDERFTFFSEVSAKTALSNFGDSNSLNANAGFRMKF